MNQFYFVKTDNVEKSVGAILDSGIEALLIDSQSVLCAREIEAARELAKMAFSEGENISANLSSEILLFLACETHVKNAIEKAGAKRGKPAVLAVFGEGRIANKKIEFEKFGLEEIKSGFGECDEIELKKRIERMALSRIN